MSMHGSTNAISPSAREALFKALGGSPVIVVDDLKGDARKGEAITNGVLWVSDRPSAQHKGVVNERVVAVCANTFVVYTVLVAASDELTHAKAEKMLRSLAALTGIQVRPPREKAPKPEDIDEDPDAEGDNA